MSDWTAGYVTDIGYTTGYYPELSPLRAAFALATRGIVCPETRHACELGFGQGLSINLHAAASGVAWWGTDFNPAQAGFARELAAASGAALKLVDEAFADFCNRSDLPEFEFIGLHGIWSWISDANRELLVEFVRRKLVPGGVLYLSHNTPPGWASFAPLRDLMTRHVAAVGSSGQDLARRIDGALAFVDELLATSPVYARAHPAIAERLAFLRGQSRQYLAHELFNRDWHPMPFGRVAEQLERAKLGWVCSGNWLDHVDPLHLNDGQRKFLAGIADPVLRESTRDLMLNQAFRRDYWVKGPRRLGGPQQERLLRAQRVILTTPRADVVLKVKGALGEASIADAAYTAVLDTLADHRPRTLEAVAQACGMTVMRIVACLPVLIGMGHVALAQDEAAEAAARGTAAALNRHLIEQAHGSGEVGHLASPVIGGGIAVTRLAQMFVGSVLRGRERPAEWVDEAWRMLAAHESHLVKDGKPIESAEDNRAELARVAAIFAEKELVVLRAAGVIGGSAR